jgi:hypothetical protein
MDAGARENTLVANMAFESSPEVLKESNFAVRARRKVAMASLRGDRAMVFAVPDEQGLAEAGAGGDEAAMADGGGIGGMESVDLVRG